MKRILGIFAALAVAMGITLVACHHEEIGIDRLVTKAVINEAVSNLANDMAANFSSTKMDGITYTACMKARHAVYLFKMGRDWNDKLYASIAAAPNFDHDDYWVQRGGNKGTYDLYRWIMDTARKSLDTPEELKAAYFHNKYVALKCVNNNGIQKEVRERISYILPYFTGTRPGESVSTEAVMAYEFAERRRAEGGDALVSTYAEIMTDFVVSLQPYPSPARTSVPRGLSKQRTTLFLFAKFEAYGLKYC